MSSEADTYFLGYGTASVVTRRLDGDGPLIRLSEFHRAADSCQPLKVSQLSSLSAANALTILIDPACISLSSLTRNASRSYRRARLNPRKGASFCILVDGERRIRYLKAMMMGISAKHYASAGRWLIAFYDMKKLQEEFRGPLIEFLLTKPQDIVRPAIQQPSGTLLVNTCVVVSRMGEGVCAELLQKFTSFHRIGKRRTFQHLFRQHPSVLCRLGNLYAHGLFPKEGICPDLVSNVAACSFDFFALLDTRSIAFYAYLFHPVLVHQDYTRRYSYARFLQDIDFSAHIEHTERTHCISQAIIQVAEANYSKHLANHIESLGAPDHLWGAAYAEYASDTHTDLVSLFAQKEQEWHKRFPTEETDLKLVLEKLDGVLFQLDHAFPILGGAMVPLPCPGFMTGILKHLSRISTALFEVVKWVVPDLGWRESHAKDSLTPGQSYVGVLFELLIHHAKQDGADKWNLLAPWEVLQTTYEGVKLQFHLSYLWEKIFCLILAYHQDTLSIASGQLGRRIPSSLNREGAADIVAALFFWVEENRDRIELRVGVEGAQNYHLPRYLDPPSEDVLSELKVATPHYEDLWNGLRAASWNWMKLIPEAAGCEQLARYLGKILGDINYGLSYRYDVYTLLPELMQLRKDMGQMIRETPGLFDFCYWESGIPERSDSFEVPPALPSVGSVGAIQLHRLPPDDIVIHQPSPSHHLSEDALGWL